jgi:quinoprotein glucose dehydrogenase
MMSCIGGVITALLGLGILWYGAQLAFAGGSRSMC